MKKKLFLKIKFQSFERQTTKSPYVISTVKVLLLDIQQRKNHDVINRVEATDIYSQRMFIDQQIKLNCGFLCFICVSIVLRWYYCFSYKSGKPEQFKIFSLPKPRQLDGKISDPNRFWNVIFSASSLCISQVVASLSNQSVCTGYPSYFPPRFSHFPPTFPLPLPIFPTLMFILDGY